MKGGTVHVGILVALPGTGDSSVRCVLLVEVQGGASASPGRGRNSAQRTTGWRGYRSGNSGQRMYTLVVVRTYLGGAAH